MDLGTDPPREKDFVMVAPADQRKDVTDYLAAVVRNARYDACFVADFLNAFGVPPETPVSADLLHKIGAWLRLALWERTGLRLQIPLDLPAAPDILEDILYGTRGFSGRALFQAVGRVRVSQLAWSRRLSALADVVVPPAAADDADDVVDAVAQFLWQFRHLAAPETPP